MYSLIIINFTEDLGTGYSVSMSIQALVHHPRFSATVMTVIVLNALVMGLETSPTLVLSWSGLFGTLHTLIQVFFVTEIVLRLSSYSPHPLRFFRDGWNVFDFSIVVLSLLPVAGPLATIARLARVLRVTRLVSYSHDLRLIVGTMLRSLPSMGHVLVLLGLLLYVYGIVGFQLFHRHDPVHWGTLGRSMISLFEMLTLESWVDMQDKALELSAYSWIFFVSFIVLAVFVVVNLFIAVVINNLDTLKEEIAESTVPPEGTSILAQIKKLQAELKTMELQLQKEKRGSSAG